MAEFHRLRGELERRVSARALRHILVHSLDLPPLDLPPDAPVGAVVRAAVLQCEAHAALPALVEAVAQELGEPPLSSAWIALRSEQTLAPDTLYAGFRILEPAPGGLPIGQVYLVAHGDERGYLTRLRWTPAEDAERWLLRQRRLREHAPEGVLVPDRVGRAADGHAYAYHRGMAGQLLSTLLAERGPFTLPAADHICHQVAEVLTRLHELGLQHGGLDPRDILRARDGSIRLLHAGVELLREPGFVRRPDGVGLVSLFDALTRLGEGESYAHRRPDAPASLAEFVDAALGGDAPPTVQHFTERLNKALGSENAAALDEVAYLHAEAALRAAPTDARAAALEHVAAPAHAYERLLASLRTILINTSANERVRVYQRIGRVAWTELGDHRAALAAYEEALAIDERADAARACIESILRDRGDWAALAEALIAKADLTEDAALRARTLRELAILREDQLGDETGALLTWIEALRNAPTDDSAARAIERLSGRDVTRWNEALLSLSEPLEGCEDPAMAPLWVRLGCWYAYKLDRPDVALPCFSEAAALDPLDDVAWEETLALYRSIGNHQLEAEVLEGRAAVHPNPTLSRTFRTRAAEIHWAQLADPERALTLLRAVISEDTAERHALALLRTILVARQGYGELSRSLELAAQHAHGADRARLYTELAELYEGVLADADAAMQAYRAAIASDPRHLRAHQGLERCLTRAGLLDELLACLHAQTGVAQTERQTIALFEQIAALQEAEFGDVDAAIRAYERVLLLDPQHPSANIELVRLLEEQGDTGGAAALLARRADHVRAPDERHALLLRAAQLLASDADEVARAELLCGRIVRDPATTPLRAAALALMATLLERRGAAEAAVDTLDRLAEWTDAPEERAGHLVHAADLAILAGDLDGAVAHLREALAQKPDHRVASEALRALYTLRGDHRAAAVLYRKELATTEAGPHRVELLTGLGSLLTLHLHETVEARMLFDEALALDESSVPVMRGLAELLWRTGEGERAAAHYEVVLERLTASGPERALVTDGAVLEMARRAAEAHLQIDAPDAALRVLLVGSKLAPQEATPEWQSLLAEAALRAGEVERARGLFRDLLESRDRGPDARRYEWALGLARATLAAGDKEDARQAFTRAAREPGADGRALSAVEDLLAEAERWRELEETLTAHVGSTPPPERAPLYARLGDLRFQHLHDLGGAADAYTLALEASKGADRHVLHRLMVVFGEAREWLKLMDVVLQIAEQVDDPQQRAKYHVTAAVIAHDELEQLGLATAQYGTALELDPTSLAAHQGLVRALDDAQRWEALERECERRMAHADAGEQASLLVRVAELRRREHADVMGALARLETACTLAPGRRDVLVALAEAYAESDAPLHAAPIHQTLLELDPFRVESYHALGAVHTPDREVDRSMLVCSVLSALGEANEEERVCYDFLHDSAIAQPKTPVTQDLFDTYIRHPSQDAQLTALIERIEPAIWISRRHHAADYGLLPEDQSAIGQDSINAVRTLRAAARTFALPMPEVYVRPREPGCLSTLIFDVPAVGLGRSALTHAADQELAFLCARQVALLRPGHGVREVVASADDLKAWVLAAITLTHPEFAVPAALRQHVDARRERLGAHLGKHQRAQLATLVDRLLDSTPQLDLNRYLAALELSADRMGLVLANDVVVAKQVIERSPSGLVPQRERLGDLLGYSASDGYVELRRVLGIAVA